MLRVAALVVAAAMMSAGAAQAAEWRITKDHWSEEDEQGYEEFVAALGESDCATADECLQSDANPYRDSDPKNFRLKPDCADLPYILRAYYASKNGLPFTYISGVSPMGSKDPRFSPNGNKVVSRTDVIRRGEPINAHRVLHNIRNQVSTGTLRVDPRHNDAPYKDFYSPALKPGSIRAGTTIYDTEGHAVVVYRVDPDGRIHYMDSHPDLTLTRSVYGPQISRAKPELGAGFKNWRPFKLVGATRAADGTLRGGKIVFAENDQIPDFSLDQYIGTHPDPGGDWEAGRFELNGIEMGYYEFVRASVSGGKTTFSPVYEAAQYMRQLCNDMQDRAKAVDAAITAGIHKKAQPDRLPDNIYGTMSMEWELYSSPSRDARLKTAMVGFREELARILELWRKRDPRVIYDGANLKQSLLDTFRQESDRCNVTYVNNAGRTVTLSFEDVMDRLFKLSFDPYHCVERRWGATSEEELASCPDNSTKQDWYEAQQRLRNQIERRYEDRMNFSLRDLEREKEGSGQDTAPDVNVLKVIENLGARVPFEGMKPTGL